MATHIANGHATKNILTVSLAKHLHGTSIQEGIEKDWASADDSTRSRFNNVGFDFDPKDLAATLSKLRQTLRESEWDGVLIGWCLRGYSERTEWFEETVNEVVDELRAKPKTKLLFCTGPTDLRHTVLRSFPL